MQLDEEKLDRLAWVHEMMKSPWWPKLRDHLLFELEMMKEAGLLVSEKVPGPVNRALGICGLEPPRSQEEQLRCYLALRAVINYVASKLKELEKSNSAYLEGVKQRADRLAREERLNG